MISVIFYIAWQASVGVFPKRSRWRKAVLARVEVETHPAMPGSGVVQTPAVNLPTPVSKDTDDVYTLML